jgi:hypothetical protein
MTRHLAYTLALLAVAGCAGGEDQHQAVVTTVDDLVGCYEVEIGEWVDTTETFAKLEDNYYQVPPGIEFTEVPHWSGHKTARLLRPKVGVPYRQARYFRTDEQVEVWLPTSPDLGLVFILTQKKDVLQGMVEARYTNNPPGKQIDARAPVTLRRVPCPPEVREDVRIECEKQDSLMAYKCKVWNASGSLEAEDEFALFEAITDEVDTTNPDTYLGWDGSFIYLRDGRKLWSSDLLKSTVEPEAFDRPDK